MKPKTIAIIPARKNSKRLPGKNRKFLNGEPLLQYTIDVALECKFIDQIIFVSDDTVLLFEMDQRYDHKIWCVSEPTEIAQDSSQAWEVVKYVIERCFGTSLDWNMHIIYLQPTSPLRTYSDLLLVWDTYERLNEPIASIVYIDKWNYKLNGAIYISPYYHIIRNKTLWENTYHFYKMPQNRSVNIDTKEDWDLAEKYLQGKIS